MFTNVRNHDDVAADIDRIGAENILAKNPFLGGDIAGVLRLKDRSTADVGDRLYRLVHFIIAYCQRGGCIPLYDLGTPGGPFTFLFVDNNTFDGSLLSLPSSHPWGAPVPTALTFCTTDDLWLLADKHPGVLVCPEDCSIVPGVDAVTLWASKIYRNPLFFKVPHKHCFAEQYSVSCAVQLLCSTCYLLQSSTTLHVGGPHNTPSISHHAFAPGSSSSDM
jgi:hypothetical protein